MPIAIHPIHPDTHSAFEREWEIQKMPHCPEPKMAGDRKFQTQYFAPPYRPAAQTTIQTLVFDSAFQEAIAMVRHAMIHPRSLACGQPIA